MESRPGRARHTYSSPLRSVSETHFLFLPPPPANFFKLFFRHSDLGRPQPTASVATGKWPFMVFWRASPLYKLPAFHGVLFFPLKLGMNIALTYGRQVFLMPPQRLMKEAMPFFTTGQMQAALPGAPPQQG